MKIGFFEIRPGEDAFFKTALPEDELIFSPEPLDESNIPNFTSLEIISTHTNSKINSTVIENLKSLKLICTRTTGFDHIDTKAATGKNIPVCNVPAYGENTVAEFAFGLLLSLSRRIPQAWQRVKQSGQFDTSHLTGFDLKDKTIGVIGTGKIGSHLIEMAQGFKMKVIGFDAFPNNELAQKLGFEYKPLDEVLKTADILSVHVPYLPSTHHLLNNQNMPSIKKGAVLINTARGAVIETQALVQVLEQGILSGVALDVLEDEESLKPGAQIKDPAITTLNKKLISMPQVYITPHLAFDTVEALQRILQTTVENIQSFKQNSPKNVVKSQP